MLQRNRKTDEFRKEVRKEQLTGMLEAKRNKFMLVEQQEKEYREEGKIGLELLQVLAESIDRECVKKQKESYPIEKFYPFLEPTYDSSPQQQSAVKIIEKYFYVGYSSPPEEQFIDKALRILIQVDNIEIKKNILLMLRDIVQDHYKYGTFLIKYKKIIPKLLSISQAFTNNGQIKNSVCKLIYLLVQNTIWHEDLPQLVDPLLRMMHEQQDIDSIVAKVETLFNITLLNPEYFAPILYEKKIQRTCLDIIKQHESRVAMLLYLKFLLMFERLLKNNDVADALDAIWFIQERGFKVREGKAKCTAYEAKLTTFRFINILLRSQNVYFRQAGLTYVSKNVQDLRNELEQSDDQPMVSVLTKVFLAFYLQSAQTINHEYQYLIQSAINKCESYNKRVELQAQYEFIRSEKKQYYGVPMEIEI